ncbi:polysaccharide ABC transporter ATP-binding protein [Gillisia hiemivivida]|uniref:ATP-binding cassette domain-containing protein n=1 Tax=Gillisia hiemivivida TaxID=291190 RepID=A0A5C6ZX35_9FLAO|nr:ABC transporter ATP-binding protein [Gillisia hiemivivida]TXD93882.1 ATP-binding cassette domain-containing protein [Gillisia hiemivivida]
MSIILKAENISKQYRLGQVGTGTIGNDLNRWWASLRGKEDPYLKVGAVNNRNSKALEDYVWALNDINFEVKTGEVLGIIGKNGAGKSTLLKILSRVTSPTTGSIKTRGRIASLLEVGTGFHGDLTGRENIFMNGAVLGMTKVEIKRKLDEIIDFSGCEMYMDTPIKRYSSGMTVRLGFAVAAHLEPEILVVDEVLAVGDAEFQKKAIGKMQDLSIGEGRTVLFVSHNMSSIKQLCSKLLVLENGISIFEGEVNEGVDFYISSETKDLTEKATHFNKTNSVKIIKGEFFVFGKEFKSNQSILLGEKLDIFLILEINDDIQDLSIAFDILNVHTELMSHITNEDDGCYFTNLKIKSIVKIHIRTDPVVFTPGFYSVNLWIGKGQDETLYEIKNLLSFYVEQGDFTKRTKRLPKHAKVYLNSKWEKNI